jgi:hypothetical protein
MAMSAFATMVLDANAHLGMQPVLSARAYPIHARPVASSGRRSKWLLTMPGERTSHSTSHTLTSAELYSFPVSGKAFTPHPPRTSIYCLGTSVTRSVLMTLPRSANYSPNGVMLLTKAVLGKVRYVDRFAEVKQCPRGFDSASLLHQLHDQFDLSISRRLSSTG